MKKILILSAVAMFVFGCTKEKETKEEEYITPIADFAYTIGQEYKNCDNCYSYWGINIFNTSKHAESWSVVFYNLDYPKTEPLRSIKMYEQYANFILGYDSNNYLVCFIAYNGTKSDSIYKEVHIPK